MTFTKLYFSLEGRISRSTFWFKVLLPLFVFIFVSVLIAVVAVKIGRLDDGATAFLLCLTHSIVIWSGIAAGVKRLHDRGKSGRAILITVIPVIGAIWYFFKLGFAKGTKGENQFGPDPLAAAKPR